MTPRIRYILVCTVAGLALAWVPMHLHGPIPEKFTLFGLRGGIIVWAWYASRLLIGPLVGVTSWPSRWWLRGPLCGAILLLAPGFVSLATPGCGPPCWLVNQTSGIALGIAVAAIARVVTGQSNLDDVASRGSSHRRKAAAGVETVKDET